MESFVKKLNIQTALESNGLDSIEELLTHPVSEISNKLKITQDQTDELLYLAANEHYSWKEHLKPASTISSTYLSTNDPGLDAILGGKGIPIGSITEIVGESSSGKTQMCLQLCFSVQKPKYLDGLNGDAVYLYSEGKFSTVRCHQLATYFEQKYNISNDKLKQHIHTLNISDPDSLFRAIAYQLPILLERSKLLKRKIRLVVIDSIGATYRGLYSKNDLKKNTSSSTTMQPLATTTKTANDHRKENFEQLNEICDLGVKLKKLAQQYQLAIVVVNQVSDKVDSSSVLNIYNTSINEDINQWLDVKWITSPQSTNQVSLSMFMSSLAKRPTLGITWSNSVTTRIRMVRSPLSDHQPTKRALFIENAPHIPRLGGEVFIDDNGIHA